MNDREDSSPVKIDLGASARLEVKAEIPSASMGRLVDALTDLIRPFTESRALKADLIRLEREEVLFEIFKKGRARLELEGRQPAALPNKFLIPFLEKASLEEQKSVLIDKWANLLASAASKNSTDYAWCIGILADLSADDAALLDQMYDHGSEGRDAVHFERFTRAQVQARFDEVFGRYIEPYSMEQLKDWISEFDVAYLIDGRDVPNTNEVHFSLDGNELRLSRLEALGLMWVFAESCLIQDANTMRNERVFVMAAQLTPKGRALIEACRTE